MNIKNEEQFWHLAVIYTSGRESIWGKQQKPALATVAERGLVGQCWGRWELVDQGQQDRNGAALWLLAQFHLTLSVLFSLLSFYRSTQDSGCVPGYSGAWGGLREHHSWVRSCLVVQSVPSLLPSLFLSLPPFFSPFLFHPPCLSIHPSVHLSIMIWVPVCARPCAGSWRWKCWQRWTWPFPGVLMFWSRETGNK